MGLGVRKKKETVGSRDTSRLQPVSLQGRKSLAGAAAPRLLITSLLVLSPLGEK